MRRSISLIPYLGVIGLLGAAWPARAEAQLLERALVIENARVLSFNGWQADGVSVLVRGGKIVQVARKIDAPFLSRRIDATGMTLTPGLIDVDSALGMNPGGNGSSDPRRRAEDAFDRFATDEIRAALSHGVTTVFLSPGGTVGVAGFGAAVRLRKDGDAWGEVLETESALCADLGSNRRPLARLRVWHDLRKQFQDAKAHREALETYEEELTDYEDELAKYREENSDAEAEDASGEKSSLSKRGREGRMRAPTRSKKSGAGQKKSDKKKDEKKPPKKPREPRRDPRLECYFRALDGEIPVRIIAHRTEDIRNALELAEEFRLELILVGATEAHKIIDEIKEADVRVVLGAQAPSPLSAAGQRAHGQQAGQLSEAGVPWVLGSGSNSNSGAASRFLLFNSMLASASDQRDSLSRVTREAAQFLGLSDRIGRIGRGMEADLVLWSADPREPGARVNRVYVAGRLAFEAPKPKPGTDKEAGQ